MGDFELVIFDCDGTLTDSEYVNNQALLDVLHDDGFTHYTIDDAYAHWVGKTVASTLLAIQMETGRTPSKNILPRYIKRVAELQTTGLKPIEGAADLIAAAQKKYKTCVASNGERSNVVESLVVTNLMQYFPAENVFTKIQVKNPKPHPDLFLFAANQMGVDPSATLVIEDSGTGVMAGAAAGMTTWGYTGSSHNPEKHAQTLKAAGANEVFASLIHIREKLAP